MKRAMLALGLLCGACGGSGPSTLVTDSVTFTGVDAYSMTSGVSSSSGWEGRAIEVTVSTAPGACERLQAETFKANTTTIGINVTHGTTDPIMAGTYNVGNPTGGDPTPAATVTAVSADASCNGPEPRYSTAGTVTFTQIDSSGVSGSLDVTLNDGTRVSGPFVAPACDISGLTGIPVIACVQ
jgi:hypothetical protein